MVFKYINVWIFFSRKFLNAPYIHTAMTIEKQIKEGSVVFDLGNSFYNPAMELNRTVSSLCVGAIDETLKICDGMSASGIRGLRYKKENKNVELVNLVDTNKRVCPLIKKNIKLNKIKNCKVFCENILEHLSAHHEYNFIELDPFGTPGPFLHSAMSSFAANSSTKNAILSATATDTAVLHGAHWRATPKQYHAKPIHEMFLYEFGTRILLAHIARVAHEYEYKIEPIMSFSHRHYVKCIMRVVRGAIPATEQENQDIGYLIFNPKTFEFKSVCLKDFYNNGLKKKKDEIIGGPIYLGKIQDGKILKKMLQSSSFLYPNSQATKMIGLMAEEKELLYYDLHYMGGILKSSAPKTMDVIEKLKQKGFNATLTHFVSTGVKTNASAKEVKKVFNRLSR